MGDRENEELIRKLQSELTELRGQLLWYKRTYEERSLAGIVYDRLRNRRGKGKPVINRMPAARRRVDVSVNPSAGRSTGNRDLLCVIVNHNYHDNSITLAQTLGQYFDWVMFDSGSDKPPQQSVRLPNIYYSALLNHAVAVAVEKGYRRLFFVCSDVFISNTAAAGIAAALAGDLKDAGLYSPASTGGSYEFCRQQPGGGLREVPFVEGFAFAADLSVMQELCPVDTSGNLYGWGLDIAAGYFAREKGMKVLIDDRVVMEHSIGTGYSRETAGLEMMTWVHSLDNPGIADFFKTQLASASSIASPDGTGRKAAAQSAASGDVTGPQATDQSIASRSAAAPHDMDHPGKSGTFDSAQEQSTKPSSETGNE